jgi:hypothetical protein
VVEDDVTTPFVVRPNSAARTVRPAGLVELETEAREALPDRLVEHGLVLLGTLFVERPREAVAVLEESVPGRVHEIEVVAVPLLGLVPRGGVVLVEGGLTVLQETGPLGLEQLELAPDELDEAPSHAA